MTERRRHRRGKRRGPPVIAGDVSSPRGLGTLLRQHLDDMAVRGLSATTMRARRFNTNAFIEFCEALSITEVQDVTRAVVERYQRHVFERRDERSRDEKRLSFRTQCELLLAVKGFFLFCAERHLVLLNPAAGLRLPRRERRVPAAVLTHEEAERILAVPDVATPIGVRDRAILEVLYSTGIRRAELIALKAEDVDAARRTLFVRLGKGRKDRIVPIGERALSWVQRYLKDVRPEHAFLDDERALFVSIDGAPLSNNRLSDLVSRAIQQSGVGKKGSCHLFRHTAATLMLEGGADLRLVQAFLGHEHLATTEIYTRVAVRRLVEVHHETHPSAKLGRDKPDDEAASS